MSKTIAQLETELLAILNPLRDYDPMAKDAVISENLGRTETALLGYFHQLQERITHLEQQTTAAEVTALRADLQSTVANIGLARDEIGHLRSQMLQQQSEMTAAIQNIRDLVTNKLAALPVEMKAISDQAIREYAEAHPPVIQQVAGGLSHDDIHAALAPIQATVSGLQSEINAIRTIASAPHALGALERQALENTQKAAEQAVQMCQRTNGALQEMGVHLAGTREKVDSSWNLASEASGRINGIYENLGSSRNDDSGLRQQVSAHDSQIAELRNVFDGVRNQVEMTIRPALNGVLTWKDAVLAHGSMGGAGAGNSGGATMIVEVVVGGTTLKVFGFRYLGQDYILAPTGAVMKVENQPVHRV